MITAVDLHAAGEHGRVIVGGVLDVPGGSMFEKKVHLEEHGDELRRLMLFEPRGYPAANCNVVLPPTDPGADAGFVIMEATEYPPMSGTNTICVATTLLETGMVPAREPLTELVLEAPAGLVRVEAWVEGGKVREVTFRNVPAFSVHLDVEVDVPELGPVRADIAYGGMFYVIFDADQVDVELAPENGRRIVRVGEMVKTAARERFPVSHPENPAISGITIAQLSGPPTTPGAHRKNVVVVSTGEFSWERPDTWTGAIDRSPCGTGTSAKMAVLHAKGRLGLDEEFVHEGILGTTFRGRLLEETTVGGRPAVVPSISGTAWITGIGQYVLDPSDPFPEGYRVGDIW